MFKGVSDETSNLSITVVMYEQCRLLRFGVQTDKIDKILSLVS